MFGTIPFKNNLLLLCINNISHLSEHLMGTSVSSSQMVKEVSKKKLI